MRKQYALDLLRSNRPKLPPCETFPKECKPVSTLAPVAEREFFVNDYTPLLSETRHNARYAYDALVRAERKRVQ